MKYLFSLITTITFTLSSCQTGKIEVVADINKEIKEVSAIETTTRSALLWVIEDSGNKATVFGLDTEGTIKKEIKIENIKNTDWEDLTSDKLGNLYIGDFGNNSGKRKQFSILKVEDIDKVNNVTSSSIINFTLPKEGKSKDFEAFFLLNNHFYIFSKERKKALVLKVPNTVGNHKATLVSKYYLKGKNTEVTSADISDDEKTIVLLNHERVWKLTNFEGENFFKGKVTSEAFEHKSQKEGICFKSDSLLYITDERTKNKGGNIYSFELK